MTQTAEKTDSNFQARHKYTQNGSYSISQSIIMISFLIYLLAHKNTEKKGGKKVENNIFLILSEYKILKNF